MDETGFDEAINSQRGGHFDGTHPPSQNAPTSYASAPYKVVPVFFATDREKSTSDGFGGTRSDTISYGEVAVSIPRDHQMGALENPSWWSLRFTETPQRDVMLLSISPASSDAFFASLRAQVQKCKRKSLLLFVHGYHVSFADAARRTAQIAYDLGFDGAPVFFSWPSQDRMLAYMVDEQSIIDAQPHLEQFLRDVLKQSNAENVYLIAHSMGSRGLARTLAALAVTEPKEVKRIKEVILAAPDIGTIEFTEQLVPALRKLGAPITLYASSNDRALALSEQLHGGKRAGESGDHLVVLNGIETIDASNTDTDFVGHSYYGDRRNVLADMWYLVNGDVRAQQRCCLKPSLLHSQPYWVFLK
ncbi:alpha/beta hydrolase [Paraburkholderia sp. CI3]|uniref:alpha/beta hydrolase n=1 Tax=Paraburkholderia sp. CI3 TaxID=2991060 RepID=UPI003D1C2746